MEFCPKCGSVIMISEKRAFCSRCNYRPKGKVKIQASEKIDKPKKIVVIREKEFSTFPIVEMNCKKCKHKQAYFWTLQTRAADESETKFYKCTKCEHTWREYR